MFRSEEMNLSEIIFVQESMWETMNFLAKSEKVMFIQEVGKCVMNLGGIVNVKELAVNVVVMLPNV